jgi:hypothetical protein
VSGALSDNFKKLIVNTISIPTPVGISVKNYFGDHSQLKIKEFIAACQDQLRSTIYDKYVDNYSLWKRKKFLTNTCFGTTSSFCSK